MSKALVSTSLISLSMLSSQALAGQVYDTFPTEIKAEQKYVFYSHGFIVEGTNPRPENARWGVYEFPKIKSALADESYHLIAHHRPKGTDPFVYAKTLAKDVLTLIAHGVKAENITIMGFSRGAFITSLTSHHLAKTPVNTILLAGCGRIVSSKYADYTLNGPVLSVYEKSDGALSCEKLRARSPNIISYKEIALDTGEEHGAFYRPIKEWVTPVKEWIKRPQR